MASVCDNCDNDSSDRGCVTQQAMIYKLYQAQADLLYPARQLARFGAGLARAMDMGRSHPSRCGSLARLAPCWRTAALTHHRPDYGFTSTTMGNDTVERDRGSRVRHPVRHAAAVPQGHRRGAAAGSGRGADVGTFRHPAARHRRGAAAGPRRLYHRLEERPRHPLVGRRLRVRRICRSPDPLHGGHGRGQPHDRGLPARRRRAGRHRGHGREPATARSRAA